MVKRVLCKFNRVTIKFNRNADFFPQTALRGRGRTQRASAAVFFSLPEPVRDVDGLQSNNIAGVHRKALE